MLMADTMAITLVIVGLLVAFQGLWLLASALWPARVAGAADVCERRAWLCFLVGLPIAFLAIAVIAVVGKTLGGPGQFLAFMLTSLLVIYSQVGVAGLVTHIGRRLRSPVDADRPWRATLRGGIVLALTFLLPIVGWFLILPVSAIIGVGATTLARRSRRGAAPQATHTSTAAGLVPADEVDDTSKAA